MSYYDLNPGEVEELWLSARTKKEFMEQIGITNRDYRALKRVLKYYNLSEEDMGNNLITDYEPLTLIHDKTGEWYGQLEVIEIDKKSTAIHERPYYRCYCHKCNGIKVKRADYLYPGVEDCGCENIYQKRIQNIKDITGQRFGDLLVLGIDEEATRSHERNIYWLCECLKCKQGKIVSVTTTSLKTGNTTSCGCKHAEAMREKRKDLTGKRFGYLMAININEEETEKRKNSVTKSGKTLWNCKCLKCGQMTKKPISVTDLLNGKRISCGCITMSYGELRVKEFLDNSHIKYAQQYIFDDCKSCKGSFLSYDFAILDINEQPIALIEYNGIQHYQPIEYFGGQEQFEIQVQNDKIKEQYCKEHNYPLLVIPYTQKDNIDKVIMKFISS